MINTIVLLLAVTFLIQEISCGQDLLSKFIQHGYKIKDRRTEVTRYNKNIYHTFELKTFKYNRITTAFNCTIRLKVNVENKLEAVVQAYKFLSNEYRRFPLRLQENVNRAFDANVLGVKNIVKCGNATTFRFQKDVTYHICNFFADETLLPPLIPNGIYKAEVALLHLNEEVALCNFFGEVYTPRNYPMEKKPIIIKN